MKGCTGLNRSALLLFKEPLKVVEQEFFKCKTPDCLQTFTRVKGKRKREYCKFCAKIRHREKALDSFHTRTLVKAQTQEEISVEFKSRQEASSEKARSILINIWGVTRSEKIDVIYEEGVRTATALKLTPNIFYWTNGPIKTLESIKTNEPRLLEQDNGENIIPGKITYRKEDFAMYQFFDAWRGDGCESFEAYLAEQWECMTGGTVNRGNKYFGKDFYNSPDGPHGRWDEMFIQWKSTLRPEYKQTDMKRWIAEQSEYKKRLLIACRSSYKSTFTLCYLVGAVLCCGDVRLLLISETEPLSDDFIGGFRSFWEIKDPYNPTRFQRLFRFYCIPEGDGESEKFASPMAHLSLFQKTAQSISMNSKGAAGSRADIIVFDDPLSGESVGTDVQRLKTEKRYDAYVEFLEVGGYVHYNATPWHEEDLTAKLLERNEKAGGEGWLYIIDPAFKVKEHARDKDIWSLDFETDVDLMFPARLTPQVLRTKLKDGDPAARTFRMQTLCMFLPEVEETQKLHFDRIWIIRNTITADPRSGEVYGTADLGFSKTKFRDPSCLTLWRRDEDKQLTVLIQEAGHWSTQEKAAAFVRLARQYLSDFKTWIIEKYASWEDLDREIKMEAGKYGVTVPIYWAPVVQSPDAKFRNIKRMESPISRDKIKFVAGPYLENLVNELENLDDTGPKRRSSSIHDDSADSLSIGVRFLCQDTDPDDKSAVQRKEMEEKQEKENRMKALHDRIFGGPSDLIDWRKPPLQPTEEGREIGVGRGAFGIPGLRGPVVGPTQGPEKKFITFSSAPKPNR
jgi:hypothetical protein